MDKATVAVKRRVLLGLLEVAAARLVDTFERWDDPVLRGWAADVEMAAREFKVLPVVGRGGRE
jgi:hypothetical protein